MLLGRLILEIVYRQAEQLQTDSVTLSVPRDTHTPLWKMLVFIFNSSSLEFREDISFFF